MELDPTHLIRILACFAIGAIPFAKVAMWGTGIDIALSNPPDGTVDTLAARAAAFYRSLGANFDIAFAEFSDRDSGLPGRTR